MALEPPHVLFSSDGRRWTALEAALVQIPAGRAEAPGGEQHVLGMHFGPPVRANCSIGSTKLRYVQRPGDIGVIPAGMPGCWEDDAACQILRLRFQPSLLEEVAEQLGKNPGTVELVPDFQLRDTRIESICRAIRADLESDAPSDPLYIDHLTNALAVRLIEVATGRSAQQEDARALRMSSRQLRILIEFVESNLSQELSLSRLAAVAGVSVTHLKTMFRNATGTTVHRYVIHRRVEYARSLFSTTNMPASEIAFAAGFAHQSHMAATMRRTLGHTPSEIVRPHAKFD